MAILFHNFPPMMTLHGRHEQLELYTDRVIVRPTGRLAKWFPLVFGTARMLYLDEVTDICLCPVRFRPDFRFRIIIHSQSLSDICADCLQTEYRAANRMIDYIEDFMGQGAFLPPANF